MKRPLQNFSFCAHGKAKYHAQVQHGIGQIIGSDGQVSFPVDSITDIGIKRIVTGI